MIKDKGKSCASGDSYRQQNERTPYKCFRCRSVDNLIAKFPKPLKDLKKRRETVSFNERDNHVLQKEPENGDDDNNQNIYPFMAIMSDND